MTRLVWWSATLVLALSTSPVPEAAAELPIDGLQLCATRPATPTTPTPGTARHAAPLTVKKPETQLIWSAK
jgi:hypothetical protein